MTQEQIKAKELVDKYDSFLYKEYNNLESKKCALIAVDEILLALENDLIIYGSEYRYEANNFYSKVKQEILKL